MRFSTRFLLLLALGAALACPLGRHAAALAESGGASGRIHLHELLIQPTRPTAARLVYTMQEAVERALVANPGVESKILLVERARMNIGMAQSAFWPRLSLTVSRNRLRNHGEFGSSDEISSNSRSHGLRATWSLFAGFAHLNAVMKARLERDVEEERLRQARLELLSTVQLQFLGLLKAKDDLNTAEESVRRLETQGEAAEAFVRVGMAPRLTVLQNEADLAAAKLQVIRSRGEVENALAQLAGSLALPPEEVAAYSGNLREFSGDVDLTAETALETALFRRPDLIIAQKSVAVAFKDVDIRKSGYAPRVDLSFDSMRDKHDYEEQLENYEDYSRSYWAVGINVSWDIFTGGDTTFGLLADRRRAEALQKDYENAVSGARIEVLAALRDIRAGKEMVAVSRKGVAAAREGYAMAEKRFQTNTGSMTDLLDAQLRLTEAENEVSRAYAEYHSARARFWYHIGQENPGLR
ncbi:MAG: TolC family protein [Desulfobulbaceae bacterium]|jgi:outer membrane protein TolC|nr:TolC family protein [Desulfobulbaceae bacterium]